MTTIGSYLTVTEAVEVTIGSGGWFFGDAVAAGGLSAAGDAIGSFAALYSFDAFPSTANQAFETCYASNSC